jgi:hypothetical protein
MDQIAALRSQIECMQAPTEQAPVGAEAPVMADEPSMMDEQDVFSSWRNSPEKAAYDAKGFAQTMDYRPQNYTDPVTGQVFKLDDRSGTFADYYKKTYGRDLAVEDVRFPGSFGSGLGGILDEKNFPEPVSYQDQLQSIRDIPQPNLQNNFMGNSARNVMSQIQQPQMQSVGRPSMPMSGGFRPEFRAGGGGIDKAIYDLKFKLNG